MKIVAIVEGHGEQKAVPKLLWRWFKLNGLHEFHTPDDAINAKGCSKLKATHEAGKALGVEHYVRLALPARPHGILIVLDADKECIQRARKRSEKLGPELLARARSVAPHVPVGVVVANRSYESWLLASIDEFRKEKVLRKGAGLPQDFDIEKAAGNKRRMSKLLGEPYEETVHMKKLSSCIGFSNAASRRSRSFRKLVKELRMLTGLAVRGDT